MHVANFRKIFTRSDLSNITFPQNVIIECTHPMKAKCLPFDKSNDLFLDWKDVHRYFFLVFT